MLSEQQSSDFEHVAGNAAGSNTDVPGWMQSMQQQWKLYTGVVAVVVIGIGAAWWYTSSSDEKNAAAAAELARIRSVFEAGQFEQALSGEGVMVGDQQAMGLKQIADTYGSTPAGQVAALLTGNSLVNLGKFTEAEPYFTSARSSSALIVEVGAIQGLASCMEATGNYAGAADLYMEAAKRAADTGLEPACYLKAALCFEAAKDTKQAADAYTTIAKQYETSEVAPQAKTGLARLGMAID